MHRRVALVVLTSAFLAVHGCDKGDPHLQVFREQAAAQREVLDILRTVKDDASMQAAREEMMQRWARMEAIKVRAGKLLPPGREMRERLEEELPAMKKTLDAIQEEIRRIMYLPGGEDFLRLQNASKAP